MPSLSVALGNDRAELLRLSALIDRFGSEHHLSDDELANLHLVLDEVVSNVIKHGRASKDEGAINVSIALDAGRLTVTVTDDGIAFNPIDAPPPNLDLPIIERPMGGLGIHIVKTLVETIAYGRDGQHNHLTLTMRVGRRQPGG